MDMTGAFAGTSSQATLNGAELQPATQLGVSNNVNGDNGASAANSFDFNCLGGIVGAGGVGGVGGMGGMVGMGGMGSMGGIGGLGGAGFPTGGTTAFGVNLGATGGLGSVMGAAGMMNAAPGVMNPFMSGVTNPFATGNAATLQGLQSGSGMQSIGVGDLRPPPSSFAPNMAGTVPMGGTGMAGMTGMAGLAGMNSIGMMGGMAGMGSYVIPGMGNFIPAGIGPGQAPSPSAPLENVDWEDLKKQLMFQSSTNLAQYLQNPTSSAGPQSFNPMMMLGGAVGQCVYGGTSAGAPLPRFGSAGLGFANPANLLPPTGTTAESGPDATNGLIPGDPSSAAVLKSIDEVTEVASPASLPASVPAVEANGASSSGPALHSPSSDAATTPNPIFAQHTDALTMQASTLAALSALDPSAFIGVSGTLKPIIKEKKPKKKIKGKPKRPLSAYNLFFRDEREKILKSIPAADKKRKRDERGNDAAANKRNDDNRGEQDFDQMGKNGKKIPHGKIGFENLAKLIGRRWQELEPSRVDHYKKLANKDMKRYKEEMEYFLTKEARTRMGDDFAESSLVSSPAVTGEDKDPKIKSKKQRIKQEPIDEEEGRELISEGNESNQIYTHERLTDARPYSALNNSSER